MQTYQAQDITLIAFFEAVAQTTPLPEDLQQQISQFNKTFTIDAPTALNQLLELGKHPHLEPIYEATWKKLQKYQEQEMNKYARANHNPDQELTTLPLGVVGNILAFLESPDPAQASQIRESLATLPLSKKS